jgi:hypothetical protein
MEKEEIVHDLTAEADRQDLQDVVSVVEFATCRAPKRGLYISELVTHAYACA